MKITVYGMTLDLMDMPNYNTLLITIVVLACGVFLLKGVRYSRLASKRNKKINQRLEALKKLQALVEQSALSAEREQEILDHDIQTLQTKLKSGEFEPQEVLLAYGERALVVNEDVNCIVEPLFEAFDAAEDLSKSGSKNGILYGIPISIKDNFGIKGYDCTIGCSNWIDKPWEEDSAVVKTLRAEGGIPFVKTTVPQTMLSYETANPIDGQTRNPQDLSRGIGGSSGGEAALIAAGGSIIGMGGDIGGSIRIPASMGGICGLKPTSYRVSTAGVHPVFKGQTNLRSCLGPMAQNVDGLTLLMQALSGPKAFDIDPTLPPLPFNQAIYSSREKLRIGYFTNLDFFEAVPAMKRGVLEAKQKLEALGHELVPWEFPVDDAGIFEQWGKSALGDGGKRLLDLLVNDELDPAIKSMIHAIMLPNIVKKLLYYLLYPIDAKQAIMMHFSAGVKDVNGWWDLNVQINNTRKEVMSSWKQHKLDAVICPSFVCPPLPFGAPAYASGAVVYTAIFNILDFVAGSLPITKVTEEDVSNMAEYTGQDLWHRTVKKGMVGSEGLVVNVQVVTLPWQEEKCLRVMKELEEAVAFKRVFGVVKRVV